MPPVFRDALRHPTLDFKHPAHRSTTLLNSAISPSPVFPVVGDLRIDEGAQMIPELSVRSFLVHAGQPAVAGHIGRQDGGEPAFDTNPIVTIRMEGWSLVSMHGFIVIVVDSPLTLSHFRDRRRRPLLLDDLGARHVGPHDQKKCAALGTGQPVGLLVLSR